MSNDDWADLVAELEADDLVSLKEAAQDQLSKRIEQSLARNEGLEWEANDRARAVARDLASEDTHVRAAAETGYRFAPRTREEYEALPRTVDEIKAAADKAKSPDELRRITAQAALVMGQTR